MEYSVVKVLAKNAGQYVYKHTFSLSHSVLEKILSGLKKKGYDIIQTYDRVKLRGITDILDGNMLRFMLDEKEADVPVVFFDETESTNIDGKQLAKKGFSGLIVARSQKNGRGRNGRMFSSPDGGVYFSFVMSVENFRQDDILKIMLISGVAVCDALKCRGFLPSIKWPNDIYINGKKVCGILCEALLKKDRVIIGIGVNVNTHEFFDLSSIATSLYLESRMLFNRAELIANVVKNIVDCDYEEALKKYRNWSNTIGKKITVIDGEKKYSAKAIDVDDNGFLLLDVDGEKARLVTGDVSIR